jgi:hypothetical protein
VRATAGIHRGADEREREPKRSSFGEKKKETGGNRRKVSDPYVSVEASAIGEDYGSERISEDAAGKLEAAIAGGRKLRLRVVCRLRLRLRRLRRLLCVRLRALLDLFFWGHGPQKGGRRGRGHHL